MSFKMRGTSREPIQLEMNLSGSDRQDCINDACDEDKPGAAASSEGLEVTNQALPADDGRLGSLYLSPVPARRTGPLYNAFSYPTKIDPEAIAIFIAAHTAPGDTVLDVFAGSGTTGIAARLCERPTADMLRRASELNLPVEWGPRHAVLYELSVIGSLLARTMCAPPDPAAFEVAAGRVVNAVRAELGWLYESESPDSGSGTLRHAIWSEVVICPHCDAQMPYWDLAVVREPLSLRKSAPCCQCGSIIGTSEALRATETARDPLIADDVVQRRRELAHVYGRTGRTTWHRPPVPSDAALIARVLETPIPAGVPTGQIRWGDLYRSGYHQGIDRVHHFYTRRNLIALGALWAAIDAEPDELHDALRLLVLSYNAAHSTLMTRVVVKSGLSDFVLTGAQSGVLYVSSLPVEKNVFDGVQRKIRTFKSAFQATHGCSGSVRVVNSSSTHLELPAASVDYVFTDPPFGGFIPYAEINQLNEAWLGAPTDTTEEAIVSTAQGKGVAEYGALMKQVFAEVSRVMKPDAAATVVFHSSKPDVWAAVGGAFSAAGLGVERTSVLDKTQVSFKQVVSEGSARGDAIFLLSHGAAVSQADAVLALQDQIIDLRAEHGEDQSPQHLYTRYVARCVELGRPVEFAAADFYGWLQNLDSAASS